MSRQHIKCEFITFNFYQFLNSALPSEPPEINGGETNYAYGDILDLNCTSKPSYPPSRLTW